MAQASIDIGGELAQGQALEVQIGLELAVALFGRAVIGVKRNDPLGGKIETEPPAFDLDRPHQQRLALLIGGALLYLHDPAQAIFVALVHSRYSVVEHGATRLPGRRGVKRACAPAWPSHCLGSSRRGLHVMRKSTPVGSSLL